MTVSHVKSALYGLRSTLGTKTNEINRAASNSQPIPKPQPLMQYRHKIC